VYRPQNQTKVRTATPNFDEGNLETRGRYRFSLIQFSLKAT